MEMQPIIQHEKTPRQRALENWDTKSWLELTAEDHKGVGSTPDKNLVDNPGSRSVDHMTDAQIDEYIAYRKKLIREMETKNREEDIETLAYLRKDLRFTFEFLEQIGRLPEGVLSDATVLNKINNEGVLLN